jgi:hypothetical protein
LAPITSSTVKRAEMLDKSSYLNVWWIATMPFLLTKGVNMNRSECCGAEVYDDTDICSDCYEHCDVWNEEEE